MNRKTTPHLRRIIASCLTTAWIAASIPAAGAIRPGFFTTQTDWHFDLTLRPDRLMTVEEFIALTVPYAWQSTATANGTRPWIKHNFPIQKTQNSIRFIALFRIIRTLKKSMTPSLQSKGTGER